ncbi:alkyl hydroperoxide reductase [Elizabethkingia anophelis]|uniref:alkyl hydroperoxide reductase n=1 Tax=Elizabethkingia anophelis TaxID=1117645 RepID=UPI0020B35B4C|nr:alkyl hydroperoxide reductase [Elizabethkingia anophelis]UTF99021.1 alkyl hydroperoxide reductase [Elizabethkingia anophelis]UTG63779.1 alkyl hydroperoxide reductase [Elizabethkingia anophelis]
MNRWLSLGMLMMFVFINSQQIAIDFPKFAGKAYDFIIFQGNKSEVVTKGTIPTDGKFILQIPKEKSPYIGMARWLITGTREGGGVDVFIPGRNFSISCLDSLPDKNNIIYNNNEDDHLLNSLYGEQISIYNRYTLIGQVLKVFPKTNKNYKLFNQEYNNQRIDFEQFQSKLLNRNDYIGQLIQVINLTNGIDFKLNEDTKVNAKIINEYISEKLNWQYLYTSGYWGILITVWVNIHIKILSDLDLFAKAFSSISSKMSSPLLRNSFQEYVKNYLNQQGNQNYANRLNYH